jgi:hypothetical protein
VLFSDRVDGRWAVSQIVQEGGERIVGVEQNYQLNRRHSAFSDLLLLITEFHRLWMPSTLLPPGTISGASLKS